MYNRIKSHNVSEIHARPKKPAGVDEKNAYIVGSGLASLAAACFLVLAASGIGFVASGAVMTDEFLAHVSP